MDRLAAAPKAGNAQAPRVLALVWLVLVPAWWFGVVAPAMDPAAPRRLAIDLDGYFLPRYVWAARLLAHGVVPLWNPYELAGVPMLGAAQGAVLYPPRMLLFGVLEPAAALHAFFVLHYLLLGAGSCWAMRTFGLGWPGAALGALVVTFQPFMAHGHYAPHWISNFAWAPFAVAALRTLLARPGPRAAAALAAVVSLQVLAGYPEYAFDTALVLALVAGGALAGAPRRRRAAALGWIGAAAVAAALVTAPQWTALAETARESVRAAGEYQFMFGMRFDRSAFPPGLRGWVDALGLLVYVPPLGWMLLAAGLVAGRVRERGTLVAWALLAWAAPTWLRDIPPFSLFRGPLCWHSLLHLPLAAFAGAGLGAALRPAAGSGASRRRAVWGALLASGALVLPLASRRALAWTALGAAGLGVAARRGRTIGVAMVLASGLGAIWTWVPASAAGALHRWAAGQPTFPDVAAREAEGRALREACGAAVAGRIVAPRETWLGVPLLAGLRTAQGYPESLAPRRMSRLLSAAGLAPQAVFPLDRERFVAASALLALLDVRCLVLPADWEPAARALGYRPGTTLADGRVVRVRPGTGAAFVEQVVAVDSEDAAFTRIAAPDFDWTRTAVVDGAGAAPPAAGGARVIGIERPAPGTIVLAVRAPRAGFVVVSETWYPGWRAEAGGVALPVRRADYALLGVTVPAGAARVELTYRPRGLGWAWWASAAGLAVIGAFALGGTRRWR